MKLIGKDLEADGSIDVHCRFLTPDKNLFPGMYMNGEIQVKNALVYSLPEDAVLSYEGKNHVFVAKGASEFEIRTVEVGNKENNFIEIVNPESLLKEDIVLKGAYALLMKMKNISDD